MSWIKFHSELTEKDKRGLPRAVRFVFLELCLMSRTSRGVLRIPRGMSDFDGVYDMLGGNKGEVREALRMLSEAEQDSDDEPMIRFAGGSGSRVLVIPCWERWNKVDDGAAERGRAYRAKSRNYSYSDPAIADRQAIDRQPIAVRSPLEKRREEEIKSDRVCGADLEPDTKRARVSDPQPPHPLPDVDSVSPTSALTREHLSSLLTRYLVLRPLLAPEHIEHLYLTAFDHKLRFGHAREAISMWHATRAPACKHASAEALLADLGRYFAKAHEHAGRSTSEDPDIAPALATFDDMWCKAQKLQSRCRDEGDERRMSHVLAQVKAHAQRVGAHDWRMVLGPVIAAYLVLDDRWLAENSYPVSGLSKRLSRLLEHKPRKPKPAPKPAPPPQPTPAERAAMARQAQADFERLTKARAAAALAPAPPRTPLEPPSAPVDPSGSAPPQDAPFPCQESASPICGPDRAARDGPVPIGQVVSLLPRLRGAR